MGAFLEALEQRPQNLKLSVPEDVEQLLDALGGGSVAGVRVTPDTALRVSGIFACQRIVAEDIAKIPIMLYRRLPDGDRERAEDHPLYQLMHDRASDLQTAFEFKEMMQGHQELRGNAYAWKVKVRGELRELLPIHPDRVQVRRLDRFQVRYTIDGQEYTPREIFHLRGQTLDGFTGLSPISVHRETVGMALAMKRHGGKFYENAARPSGVAEHPTELSETAYARLRKSIESGMTGENIFKIILLEEGTKFTPLSLSHKDLEYVEHMRFTLSEIAAIWRIPPHMIGGSHGKETYQNVESANAAYVSQALDARMTRWEQRLNADLLTAEERGTLYFEFLPDKLLRGLTKDRYEAYGVGIDKGFLLPSEARRRENLPHRPELDERGSRKSLD